MDDAGDGRRGARATVSQGPVGGAGRRLAIGLPLLERIHALLADVDVSAAGRTVQFSNHIEPGDVLAGTRAGTRRIRCWHPTPAERRLAGQADHLAAR